MNPSASGSRPNTHSTNVAEPQSAENVRAKRNFYVNPCGVPARRRLPAFVPAKLIYSM